jgi:type III restriction enzyme
LAQVIKNPVINSAFLEPSKHFRFDEEGITNEVVLGRRVSSYFIPIAQSRKKGVVQLSFDTEWTQERVRENEFINQVRSRVDVWRRRGYPGITRTSTRLLQYWTNPERDKKLFFCQIEAIETAIFIAEAAKKQGDVWIENQLVEANENANPSLFRIAFKMATGAGKTVVMAMLIAWQALNKIANSQDARFSDTFLLVTPGITIRDRLRVLLPNDPQNYYRERDILPVEDIVALGKAKILVTNFHAFRLRERMPTGRLTKSILIDGEVSPFTETPEQMVRRVCRDLGNKRNIIVINDEAHHCYRRKPDAEIEKLKGEERKEAELRDEEARVWISGLEAVKAKIGVRVVYDLSATPFFLRGSGYAEGTLFPWVVSDFSLIDAIESGIVKVPRVPVTDDSGSDSDDDHPMYRSLWLRVRDDLPRKGRKLEEVSGDPKLPKELQGAIHSLYSNYEKRYRQWAESLKNSNNGYHSTPPVMIVVCANTNTSKIIYDYIAGYERKISEENSVLVPGQLPIFSNVDNERWRDRPNTILIDSQQLESGDAMSADFKKIAAREIEEFKAEYKERFPGRDINNLTDEDLLREVMNTVGKRGKLGEHVKCVVSVSMLTEGWDANTVTHILGVRAFGTQLLCEQVVGRALRRTSYAPDEKGMFSPEYAEVYGIPFSFIPTSGSQHEPVIGPMPTRVRAIESRIACEITFPRLVGYRYEVISRQLRPKFDEESTLALSSKDAAIVTTNAPIVGESVIMTLDDLKRRRQQEVAFLLAKLVLEKYFRADGKMHREKEKTHRFEAQVQSWLFPQVLSISSEWLQRCVTYKDNTFPQMLLLTQIAHEAADKIYHSIVKGDQGEKTLRPILKPYDTVGSTRHVDFDTTKPTYQTDPAKCHVSHVVADTKTWEQKMAQALEDMAEVRAYVKNHNLGFTIPYTFEGHERQYIPDFIVRVDSGRGDEDFFNMIIEISGEVRKDKAQKVATARDLWVPSVNNHKSFGRWAFAEVTDPWSAQKTIRAAVRQWNSLN